MQAAEQTISEYSQKQKTIDAAVSGNDPLIRYLSASDELKRMESQIISDLNSLHSSGQNKNLHDKLQTWAMLKVYVVKEYGSALDTRNEDQKREKGKAVPAPDSSYVELVNTLNNSKNWRIHVATFYPEGMEDLQGKFPEFEQIKKDEKEELNRQQKRAQGLLEEKTIFPPGTMPSRAAAAAAAATGESEMETDGSNPSTSLPDDETTGRKRRQTSLDAELDSENKEDLIELIELTLDDKTKTELYEGEDDEEDVGEWIPAPTSGADKEE